MTNRLFFMLAAGVFAVACTSGTRVVRDPLIETANTATLDFPRIELSDSATVLHVDAYFNPGMWIRISSETYLQADGRKYPVLGGEGIDLDSLFWMPQSGEASFRLRFGPLPRGTKSFDFIESDCDDCFKYYGIDLTGRKSFESVPAELLTPSKDGAVPEPSFTVGETTVNLHLLGFREGMYREATLYLSTITGEQQPCTAAVDPATGTATFRFEQYGPATALVTMGAGGTIWLSPGETADIYLDLRQAGRALLRRRHAEDGPVFERGLYAKGVYGDLNNLRAAWDGPRFSMNSYSGNFIDYRMTADEYTQAVVSRYESLADSIARCERMPAMLRELSLLTLRQETLGAMAACSFLLELDYRRENDRWDRDERIDYRFAELGPEHFAAVANLFDIGDPKLLMGENMLDYIGAVVRLPIDWGESAGIRPGFAANMRRAFPMFERAAADRLSDADLEELRALDDPFYADACEAIRARVRREMESAAGKAAVEPAPDVPLNRLFETIIAPYGGKVVFVDFWNTWCAPCRAAIKQTEPLKNGELKDDDLVWIYIANETSPLPTYLTMIPNIRGKHYRLNEEQWRFLCEKFDIDGIPSYVVVDRNGSYELRNDLRDHEFLRRTLKKMLEEDF